MKYDLTINQHNIKPHLDIERSMEVLKDGLFSFDIRINQGNIEDYVTRRTITHTEYRTLIITLQKSSAPRDIGTRGEETAIRPDKR